MDRGCEPVPCTYPTCPLSEFVSSVFYLVRPLHDLVCERFLEEFADAMLQALDPTTRCARCPVAVCLSLHTVHECFQLRMHFSEALQLVQIGARQAAAAPAFFLPRFRDRSSGCLGVSSPRFASVRRRPISSSGKLRYSLLRKGIDRPAGTFRPPQFSATTAFHAVVQRLYGRPSSASWDFPRRMTPGERV